MLTIVKSNQPLAVTTIITCIYGLPGVGKTSLASSAESPLLLDFDAGSYRSQFRKDVVQIKTWEDVARMSESDLGGYKTIIIDTVGRALDVMAASIINENPKMANKDGGLTLQGYGAIKGRYATWMKTLRSFGKDIIIIAHSVEVQTGDVVVERIDAMGSSKNEVYKSADLMGRLGFQDGKRVLNFNPTDTAFGKNPVQIPAREVPSLMDAPIYFGTVMSEVKNGLSRMDAESAEVRTIIDTWSALIEECVTVDDFNDLRSRAAETKNRAIATMLSQSAKRAGFKFNKVSSLFEAA